MKCIQICHIMWYLYQKIPPKEHFKHLEIVNLPEKSKFVNMLEEYATELINSTVPPQLS